MAKDYTKTLNLPQTKFSMRANLPQREPEMLKEWDELDIYSKINEKNSEKPLFVLHDGPPFSNGNIHMGTAMNKIIKDIINKSKMMGGYKVTYIPGWDNHGMPIESAIIKQNKMDRKKMSVPEFRSACEKFARKYIDLQRSSFIRLGVLGDWQHPYTTMAPEFEAAEVKVFGKMFEKGYIYKGLKPVYWCNHDETALAEAEIEYSDDACTSIYVKFKLSDDCGRLSDIGTDNTYFIIWTTTTWTLPGNLAIALNPRESYAVVGTASGQRYIVAEALVEKTMKAGSVADYEIIKTMPGSEFEFMKAEHPFLDRKSVVVNAEYVTMDSGTGCVHTAPGFGADDYQTCKRYGIDIIVPVDDKGYQTEDAGKFAGLYYEESNKAILEDMKESGALLASEEFTHSYPHCWRCKHPIIFRATPQWFCSVDAFKEEAVNACKDVQWIPAWGGERITQMIRERADWCISRQRHWGLPIPVFYCSHCGRAICDESTINKISGIFAQRGSNAWYTDEAKELLPEGYTCPDCGCSDFVKETDTLDCWFDSGSTHFAVLGTRKDVKWPADLYLEGGDQYRGWFQSSLLTAVAAGGGGAPYKTVLTHGWTVDGEGKAMHKSLGNTVAPEDMIKKYGADLVRLWAASSDYKADVRVSDAIFSQLSESYRKIRNTARIILANLGDSGCDFDPDKDMIPVEELLDIDKWALTRLEKLIAQVLKAYSEYDFHIVTHAVVNFCTVDMSKLYIDITKDRVYVERKDSRERRSAQTAMYIILSSLTRLIAPVLSFTADEIWRMMPHASSEDKRSVLLNDMPAFNEGFVFVELEERYNKLFALREDIMKALELARAEKLIGKSLDAKLTIYAAGDELELLREFSGELATICIVSQVIVSDAPSPQNAFACADHPVGVVVGNADGEKCDRCWMYTTDVTDDGEGRVCRRCKKIVG